MEPATKGQRRFAWFAVAVLLWNLPVIIWGAYVRVSYSGDGCGAHWPTCDGQFIPKKMALPMAIEYAHRMMTTLDTVAMLVMLVWAFRVFARKHPVRRYAVYSAVLLFVEALLGAGLVLFRFVAKDQSAGRVWYLSAHLTNTLLLLGALTLTVWLAFRRPSLFALSRTRVSVLAALGITLLVSVTGAITALGDTLFPATSLNAGLRQDFAAGSHILLKLRVAHPAIAFIGAAYLVWIALKTLRRAGEGAAARSALAVIGGVLAQLAAGMANLLFLAPVALQLLHLFLADVVWIAVVWMTAESVFVRSGAGAPLSVRSELPSRRTLEAAGLPHHAAVDEVS